MIEKLTLLLKVPLIQRDGSGGALCFSHWLPDGSNDCLTVERNGMRLSIWLDAADAGHRGRSREELLRHVVIPFESVRVQVDCEISPEFATYLRTVTADERKRNADIEKSDQYHELGLRILVLVADEINKLLRHCKVIKGQYWLEELGRGSIAPNSQFAMYEAKVTLQDGTPIVFRPAPHDCVITDAEVQKRYLQEADWRALSSVLENNARLPLVLDLLAGAEALIAKRHYRNAIVEAVTALEVGLSDFLKRISPSSVLFANFQNEVATERLSKIAERIGLTASIDVLLPLLLPRDLVPPEVLDSVRIAIETRQNVVHNGQRKIDNPVGLVRAIRLLCETLLNIAREKK